MLKYLIALFLVMQTASFYAFPQSSMPTSPSTSSALLQAGKLVPADGISPSDVKGFLKVHSQAMPSGYFYIRKSAIKYFGPHSSNLTILTVSTGTTSEMIALQNTPVEKLIDELNN
jgi:hypothetical protein